MAEFRINISEQRSGGGPPRTPGAWNSPSRAGTGDVSERSIWQIMQALGGQFSGAGFGGVGSALSRAGGTGNASGALANSLGLEQLAGSFAIFNTAVQTFRAGVNYFIERGKELEKYSGPLSAAYARADVRKIQADVFEAQQTGEGISRLVDAQSRIETSFQKAMAPLKGFAANNMADVLEGIADTVETVGTSVQTSLELMTGMFQVVIDFTTGRWEKAQEDYDKAMNRLERAMTGQQGTGQDLMQGFLGGLGGDMGIPLAAVPVDPMRTQLHQKLNQPGLGGGDF